MLAHLSLVLLARKRKGTTGCFHPVNISDFDQSVTHCGTDVFLYFCFSLFPSMHFFSLILLTYFLKIEQLEL